MSQTYRATDSIDYDEDDEDLAESPDWQELLSMLNKADLEAIYHTTTS